METLAVKNKIGASCYAKCPYCTKLNIVSFAMEGHRQIFERKETCIHYYYIGENEIIFRSK